MSTFRVYSHVPCLPCIQGSTGMTGPVGTIFQSNAYNVNVNPVPLGPPLGTVYEVGNVDDSFFEIPLPFPVTFLNNTYTTAYLGTNSYLTFGGGSDTFFNLSGFNPPFPGLLVNANNNSLTKYYLNLSDEGSKFTIRYEGLCAMNIYIIPEVVWTWEVSFYKDNQNIDIGWITPVKNTNGTVGIFKISSGSGSVQNLPLTDCGVLLTPWIVTYNKIRFSGDGISVIYNNDVRTPIQPGIPMGELNIQPLGGITADTSGNITRLGSANSLTIQTDNGLTLQTTTNNNKCADINFTCPSNVSFNVDDTHNVNISRPKFTIIGSNTDANTLYVDENKFLRVVQD